MPVENKNNMKNILFITLQYDINNESEYIAMSKNGLQTAVNTYQTELIKGFSTKEDVNVQIVNTIPIGIFPTKCKKILFKNREWAVESMPCKEIGFINLPIVKQYMRYRNYYKAVKKWVDETNGERFVIIYSLYLPFEKVALKIKKIFPFVKIILICADLPCKYGILPKNRLKSFIYSKYGEKTMSLSTIFDGYILLTEQMKYPLQINNKPYIVVEAVVEQKQSHFMTEKFNNKMLLYAGTLNYKFGIENLVKAFQLIKSKEYKLVVCGEGEASEYIKSWQKKDSRIEYLGFQSQEKIKELEKKARLLVNPRPNEGEYTKYSFPSKTVEYMESGTPVLMFKLSGVPDEYDNYLYYFNENDVYSMSAKIVEICEKPDNELIDFGLRAKFFVKNQKNGKEHANNILKFLEEV